MITKIQFYKLRNDEFIQFIKDILLICKEGDPDKLQIRYQYDELNKLSTTLETAYLQSRSSELTQEISAEDEIRDSLITGIEQIASGNQYHYDRDYVTAAEILLNRIKLYGSSIARMNYKAETAALTDLIDHVKTDGKLSSAVEKLALKGWFTVLEESNIKFNKLYLMRVNEYAESPNFNLKEIRTRTLDLYRELIKHVEAYSVIGNSGLYNSLIVKLNTLIEDYNRLRRKVKNVNEISNTD